jgi:NAD-dependent deacetylase
MNKPKLVVLSGAGVSAESGLATFRDSGGLWEGHRIEDVATPEAWRKDKELVLEFYNLRRKAALDAKPNAGHLALVELEKKYEVIIITQNVDDLHEKAGSSNVIHYMASYLKAEVHWMKNWCIIWRDGN